MKHLSNIFLVVLVVVLTSCNKPEPPVTNNLPEGATPYSETDIQFVPYQSADLVFKKMPALDSTWILNFKERVRSEEYFAWDQTYFNLDIDPTLEFELRLRYLQTDNSQKTLAVYMPYRDNSGTLRTNLFEMPITPVGLEQGFFTDLIDYHDTIVFNSIEWYNVFEVNELLSTDAEKDGPTNFSKIYYNTVYGIIKMDQNNGTNWILQQ
ncbi:MAG: hypothetical protein ACI857_000962 [Arenicella sp.]|jgi:hypothetical protein